MNLKDKVSELEHEKHVLQTRVKHLVNELDLTRKEYETTAKKYFDIYSTLGEKVMERTRQLEEEKSFSGAILDNSYDGIAVIDNKGTIKFINKSMERIVGYTKDELPTVQAWASHALKNVNGANGIIRQLLHDAYNPNPPERITEIIHGNGQKRWCRFQLSAMTSSDIVINCMDITERKKTEDELSQITYELKTFNEELERRIEERLEDLLSEIEKRKRTEKMLIQAYDNIKRQNDFQRILQDSIPIPVYYKDDKGYFTGCNKEMAQFLGQSEKEIVGKRGDEIKGFGRRRGNVSMLEQSDVDLLKNGGVFAKEITLQNGKNERRSVILHKAAYYDQNGNPAGVIGAFIDITDKKEAEREAESRRQQLLQADKMVSLGILTAGVAHEINNPNNFVMMNTPIIQKAWKSIQPILDEYERKNGDFSVAGIPYSEMKEFIPSLFDGIKNGSERIKNIVRGLKDYARQDTDELSNPVNVNDVVNASLTLLANMIKKSTDNFVLMLGENLPCVLGSGQKIEQVVINIIQNACQALTDKKQRLLIKTGYDSNHDCVWVVVSDEGRGMTQDILKHIQDPFFTTKRDTGGTGLGLSISSGIVQDHGGILDVHSNIGEGTTVIVSFPSFHPEHARSAAVSDHGTGDESSKPRNDEKSRESAKDT